MSDLSGIDRPAPSGNARMGWTSDLAAGLLRRLGIKYVAQNPGSGFGALHDSMVNYLGKRRADDAASPEREPGHWAGKALVFPIDCRSPCCREHGSGRACTANSTA